MRFVAVVAVLAVPALLGACGDDEDAAPPPSTATSTATTTPAPGELTWEPCGTRECTSLAVPLDWDDPDGPTIDLAISRIPAGDPANRIGVLITNPGGPGASGIGMLAAGNPFTGEIADRFDIVSFDPRGVGDSAGLECAGDDVVGPFLRLDSDPDTPEEQAALDAAAEAVADDCASEAELLANVGTDSVAADLEAIRIALGQPMAYVGFSYGTFLGLRYAELFPTGARSIVLDGAVDPTHALTDVLRSQTEAFDTTIDEVLASADTAAIYDRLATAVEEAPLPGDRAGDVGPSELATAAIMGTYDRTLWARLNAALVQADDGDGTQLAQLASLYRSLGEFAPYQAVNCLDSENPTGAAAWAAFADELEAISPRFGAAVANEMLPCAFWPVAPDPVVGPVRAEGAPPILVIGTTGDAATPLAYAERVAAGLADGHLLVYEGEGHTAIGKSDCVDDAVAAYLIESTLPAEGARC